MTATPPVGRTRVMPEKPTLGPDAFDVRIDDSDLAADSTRAREFAQTGLIPTRSAASRCVDLGPVARGR